VRSAVDYEDGLNSLKALPPTFAIVDVHLPGRSGLELATAAQAISPATTILILTGAGEGDLAKVKQAGLAFLRKPVDADEILAALQLTRPR
jgi:two-component system response regulator RegA